MRMAYDDYDLLYTLEKKISKDKVKKMLNDEGVVGYTEYPHSKEWHEDFINRIKREIAKN